MKNYCIIDTLNSKITDKLREYGYICISTEKSANVSEPIAFHTDVLYLKFNEKDIYVSDCQVNNISFLKEKGYNLHTISMAAGYHTESKLNAVITNKTIICNPKTCIESIYADNNKEIIKVNQGYTKCSTVVISDNDFITEDTGIYEALKSAGKNCLLIEKGSVALKGYNYGFIGGASAFLEKHKTLLFFGDIKNHKNYNDIVKFCNCLKINIDYIENMELTDIGGIVII